MKKIVLLLVGLLISCLSFGQTKIWSSDFSNVQDWTISSNGASGLNWVFTKTKPTTLDANNGWVKSFTAFNSSTASNNFIALDATNTCTGSRKAVITSSKSFSTLNKSNLVLKFSQLYAKSPSDIATVEISTDNKANWKQYTYNNKYKSNTGSTNPENVVIDISADAAGQASVWVRFVFTGTTGTTAKDYGWFIDDFSVEEIPNVDALGWFGFFKSKTSSCGLVNDSIGVYIINKGVTPLTSKTTMNYKINNNLIVTENSNFLDIRSLKPKASLVKGDTAIHFFSSKIDISNPGTTYNVLAFVNAPSDSVSANDTVKFSIINYSSLAVTNLVSYNEDFENQSLNGFTAEDVDKKGLKFGLAASGNLAVTTTTPSSNLACLRIFENNVKGNSDDWAFSRCLDLDPNYSYTLSYYSRSSTTDPQTYAGKLSVSIGNSSSAASMKQKIVTDKTLTPDGIYHKNTSTFNVDNAGTYYLGFRGYNTSADSTIAIRIDDISLTGKGKNAEILTFSLQDPSVIGIVNGKNITLNVASNTDISALIANFTTSPGAIVKVLNKIQVSGTTPNDFTSVVTYTVTSEDGLTTNDYMVTVNVQQSTKSPEKDFLTYVINGVSGVISTVNKTISLTLPSGTLLNNLTAKYTTSPKSSITTGSNTTDFTNPVTYVITAEDGSTKTYTVTVTLEQAVLSNLCDLTSFTLGLTQGSINNNQIIITLPSGSSLSQTASFVVSKGSTVKVNGVIQQSGLTSNTYSSDLIYEVTAEDGVTKKSYTVKVSVSTPPVLGCKDLDNWKDGANSKSALYATDSTGYSGNGYFTGTGTNYFQGIYEKFETLKNDSKTYKLNSVRYSFGALVAGNDTNTIQFIGYLPTPGTDLPGKVKLFSKRILVKTVKSNLTSTGDYLLDLSGDNLKVKGSFYAGIQYKYRKGWKTPNVGQDTIALYTNTAGAQGSTINSAYCMYKTSATDTTFDTIMPTAYKFSLGVYANVCDLSSANDLLSFNFASPTGSVSTNGTSISITLPIGTDPSKLSSLVAIFSSSPKTTVTISQVNQVSGQTSNDFTTSKVYTVTAEDGSKKDYTVTVTIEKPQAQKSSAKDFVTFSINGKLGVIGANTISVVLPAGTSLINLTPSYTTSDKAIVTSGASITDFSNPVTYVITAEDGSTKTYTVTVTLEQAVLSNLCDLTSFTLGLTQGSINNNQIIITLPSGSSLSQTASFVVSKGSTVKVNGVIQQSGLTSNTYSSDLIYEVTAEDGVTKKSYTVKVSVSTPPVLGCKDLDNWKDGANSKSALYATDSTGYSGNGYFTGTGTNYFQGIYEKFETLKNDSKTYKLNSVRYSFGALVAGNDTNTIQFIGYLPTPGTDLPGKVKLFSKRILVKTVKSNLTSTGDYLLDLSGDNLKVKGSFYAGIQYKYRKGWKTPNVGQDTIALYTNTAGAQGSTINSAYCMYKTSATDTTFDTIMPTAYKFSLGVYANVCDLSSANDLLSFNFASPTGSVSTNGTSISITLPIGTDPSKLSSLVAIFSSSPKTTVTISQVNQVSGQTSNDFTTSKVYTVTAEDGSKKDYTVTVTIEKPQAQKSSAKDFVTFSINGKLGVIGANTISVVLPAGTSLINLTPSYTTSDKAIVTSGASTKDFSNPVTYVITAEDGSTKTYTVTVTVGSTSTTSGADIVSFGFANPNVTGIITGTTIAVTVPYGTNVNSLVSTFTASTGATVKVSNILQNSGGSVINYSSPVTFTVTSQDGKTVKTYIVSVSITPLLSSAKEMMTFGFASPNANGTITGNTIGLTVPFGTNLSALVANFTSSPNSIVRVGSTVQVSGTTPNSFVSSLMYTVVAQDGSAKDYTVVVTVSAQSGGSGSSAKDILSFGLLNPYISGTITGNTITISGQAGSDITKQQITFSVSPGATLTLNGVVQTTNISIVNFSNPVTFKVTATDGTTKEYIVTVTIPKKSDKAFTFFRFIETPSAIGVIDEAKKTITVHVPNSFAKNLNFTAVFGVSAGAIVKIGNIQQSSGASQLPYKSTVVFTVVAEDESTAMYTVIIIVDPQVVGIEEEEENFARIFPNPSTGLFTCESSIESYDLTITDILGHTVYFDRIESNGTSSHTFDVTSFGSGVYFATLHYGTSSKLIKLEVIK